MFQILRVLDWFRSNKEYQYFKILITLSIFIPTILFPKCVSAQSVINEFVVDGDTEWVEFYNASESAEYLKSYYIDDDDNFTSDTGSSGKKILTSLNITNINFPYIELSSSIFNNTPPDNVVLFDNLGNVVDSYSYISNPGKEMSIGRSPDRTGDFFMLISTTKGFPNTLPIPSPTPTPEPTQSPTKVPTSEPTTAPTKSPSPKPSISPSPKPSPTAITSPSPSMESEILGISTDETLSIATATPMVAGVKTVNKSPVIATVLIIFGFMFLGYVGFNVYKNIKSEYNKESYDSRQTKMGS